MKRVLLLAAAFFSLVPLIHAQGTTAKRTAASAKDNKEIHWITDFNELEQKMKENPKKVYFDVYTDWCGWCKKMEATTFQNPDLIKYINLNYYAVRFNAERQDVIHFNGKEYHYEPQYKLNTLTLDLMPGKQPSFPTSVIMMENFQNHQPIQGYLTTGQIEPILTYFGDNAVKHQTWEAYSKDYKGTWDHGMAADMTPPPGH
jgi:thioredoxin-related protein